MLIILQKGTAVFTEEEEQEFLEMSRRPDIYEVFSKCIAPSIYGNQDIKKPLLVCLWVDQRRFFLME